MSDITVKFKDGSVREFPDHGAPGGSYCNHLRYEGAFVVIEDPYGKTTAFPAADVAEVQKESGRR